MPAASTSRWVTKRSLYRPVHSTPRERSWSTSESCSPPHFAAVRERTSAGLIAARAEGRVGGRRPKLTAAQRADVAENVLSGRRTAAEMARLYKVSGPTISRLLAAHRRGVEGAGAAQR